MSDKVLLKDCCKFQEGYVNPSQKNKQYFGGDIKWLRASDLNDGFVYNTERKLSRLGFNSAGKSSTMFKSDTLAISKSGTIGRLGILKATMCGNRAVINIDVQSDIADLFYVFYTLKHKKKELLSKASGSIQKNLYVSALETISLNHSDLPTQKAISSILSNLDKKIELNNQINQELENMAKLLYDYWFVQFDFPDANGKPYKSSGGAMVYNEQLKREIPLGWEVKKLKTFAKTASGGTPLKKKKEYYENGNIPWINSGELNHPYIIESSKFITEKGLSKSSAKIFQPNTILLAMYGATAGKTSLLQISACTNQAICAIVPTLEEYTGYIKFSLSNLYEYLVRISSGSARDNLSQEKIQNLELIVPNISILNKYEKTFKDVAETIKNNTKQNQQLAQLRDWLLPMLMNGQVTIH